MVLLLALVVAGSPWVQRPLRDFYEREFYWYYRTDEETLRWILQAAFAPGWDTDSDWYGSTAGLMANDLAVIVLFAGLAFVASRPAMGRLRRLGASVLVTALSQFVWWGLYEAFAPDTGLAPAGTLLKDLLRTSLIFGLAVGVLIVVLADGRSGTPAARSTGALTAPFRRSRQGGLGMTTAPDHMPVGTTPGDVTRYLCAAAYVDEQFADRVVEDVMADEVGAVAASPGVDLVTVARHCLTAQELRLRRDQRLTAAYAVVAVFAPLWLLFVTLLLSATRQANGRPSLATRGRHQPEGRVLVGTGITAGVMVLFAFLLGTVLSALPTPGFVSWLLGSYLGGIPAVLLSLGAVAAAYATVVRHDLDVDRLLRTTMTREAFARQPRPTVPRRRWMAERLAALREAQDGNVTVYSGYTPFLGYAPAASQWSVAVPLLPADGPAGGPARAAAPEVFGVAELVDHVRARLRAVATHGTADGAAADGARSLESLFIEDRVFASGTSIGDDERFIRTTSLTPAARLSPDEVERIMEHPTGAVRHCLAFHVPLWGGDVVPSVFLHFSTAGTTLHLHCSNHVLGPVRAEYHVVDRLRGPLSPGARRTLLLDAVPRTGGAFHSAPFRALRQARFEERHSRRMSDELKALEQDPVYDFGARLSVRELAVSPNYHNYFQVVDAGRITSLVERHTFAAIREFLDARGYDTTDFRAQQQTILNQGLIQQGGMSIIGNQAIGTGATATQNVPQQPGATTPSAVGGAAK